jgi:hypothetical protein
MEMSFQWGRDPFPPFIKGRLSEGQRGNLNGTAFPTAFKPVITAQAGIHFDVVLNFISPVGEVLS